MKNQRKTYLLICSDLQKRGEASLRFACLMNELFSLLTLSVIIVQSVKQGITEGAHELI